MPAPEHPWVGQYQGEWQLRSANPNLPQWLRVVSLAYGSHRANGHAPFPTRAVADALGTVDPNTGELFPDVNVSKWIKAAVDNGFIARGSTARCLVVPGHTFNSAPGHPGEPCPWHDGRRRRRGTRVPQVREGLPNPY